MTIQLHDRRKEKKTKLVVLSIILVSFVCLGFFSPIISWLSAGSQNVAVPFWKVGGFIGDMTTPVTSYFSSKTSLSAQNKELQFQVDSMVAKLADRDLLRNENQQLKNTLGRTILNKRIFAVVLSKPGQAPYDMLIVDAGKKENVVVGQKVLFENVLIGEVSEVFSNSSKVVLYSSSERTFPVFVGEKALEAQAVGRGGGNYEVKMPRNSGTAIGDTIYVPHIQPRVLGTVEKIESGPKDVFELLLFKSPVNFNTLRFVEISFE
jgi:cell shape-determining protein MreC